MATYTRETATIQEVYLRREYPGGNQAYLRLPFNLVTYDDRGQYVEPLNCSQGAYTFRDFNTDATDGEFLIVDAIPFSGVTEIW